MDDIVISRFGATPGWSIHFYPGELDSEMPGSQPRAAIITKVVNENNIVNVVVFDIDGCLRTFTGVVYDKEKSKARRWCYISDTIKSELNG